MCFSSVEIGQMAAIFIKIEETYLEMEFITWK